MKRCRLLRRFLGKETISGIEFEAKLSGFFDIQCKVGIYVYQFVTPNHEVRQIDAWIGILRRMELIEGTTPSAEIPTCAVNDPGSK